MKIKVSVTRDYKTITYSWTDKDPNRVQVKASHGLRREQVRVTGAVNALSWIAEEIESLEYIGWTVGKA